MSKRKLLQTNTVTAAMKTKHFIGFTESLQIWENLYRQTAQTWKESASKGT